MAPFRASVAASAALLLLLSASAISVALSAEAPAPVAFRADDGVVSISSPEEFAEAISRSRKASIVYFYLPRCPACAQTKSVLLTAANKLEVSR
jgi:thioredoxin-like negative regulator of GroEL